METVEDVELEGTVESYDRHSGHVVTDDGVRVSVNFIALRISGYKTLVVGDRVRLKEWPNARSQQTNRTR